MKYLVTHYLDETVDKYPNKIAFVDKNRKMSFRQLQEEALKVANSLLDCGCFKAPIMMYMDKSTDCVSSFLGAAYSGNFYSPIDTKMPESRIKKIVDTLRPVVVITHAENKEHVLSFAPSATVLVYEEIMKGIVPDKEKIAGVNRRIVDTDVLYAFFTSGSTGTPKGVLVTQRNVIDYINWVRTAYDMNDTAVIANETPFYFDLSVQDIYLTIFGGSTTVIIRKKMFSSPVRVWKIMMEHKVNTFLWVPSMLSLFANMDILSHVDKIPFKTIFFCGEVMPVKQLNYWRKYYPETKFVNLYGPTECTVACTYYDIDRDFADEDILPIGKPCANVDAMIIDEKGNLVEEPGVEGELCIRGTTVGLGYFRNPEKTAQVFIQNPTHQDYPEVVYRTGDLVSYNERHELMYIGRMDFQVKRRGYRIELGEIEAAVSSLPEVTYNCCMYKADTQDLVLVYTGDIAVEKLKQELSTRLQDYMVPTVFYQREDMLFNLNGKIDRKALGKEYGLN